MIETERVLLRSWEEADAEAMYRYACDPDVGPVAGWAPHPSVDYSREIIRTVFSAPETYAVVLKSIGEPVGSCGLMFADGVDSEDTRGKEAEIGYWIGKPYWGQGLIPEAVKALLEHAFNELGLETVWCSFYDGNDKSKRVCEKCGFKYHHTKADVPSPLGDLRTEHYWRLTKEEYKG